MKQSLWPRASNKLVEQSLSAHSVMGLVISAILYIVCLSGTVAVLEDEFGWWEAAQTPAVQTVTPQAAQTAAENVLAAQPDTSHVYLYLPRENWPRFVIGGDDGVEAAGSNGEIVGAYETAWNSFLIHLHYYLNLPEQFGMILVAIFGVMMIAMSISGLLAHPRIFRDAFRLKTSGQQRLVQADLHNRLSVWTLPFNLIVAGTGAVIGLFVVVALVLAQTSFDGDTRALSEAIFGDEPAANEAPAPLADVETALVNFENEVPGVEPFLIIVHDPGTAGQHIDIQAEHSDRLIYGEAYQFDGDGTYLGHAGFSDGSAGRQIAYSVYRLHFGDFGGTAMKIAYLFLGALLCFIVATGLNIYLLKSAEKGQPKQKLAAAWSACVWGAPALLALTLLLSLVGLGEYLMSWVFWTGLTALSVGLPFVADAGRIGFLLRRATGAALILASILHQIMFFNVASDTTFAVLNACLIVLGAALVAGPFWIKQAPAKQTQSVLNN